MCLAIPGRVVERAEEDDVLMGKVDFGGLRKRACLAYVPDVSVGDYVLVHAGFALARIDEDQARLVFALLDDLESPREAGTL